MKKLIGVACVAALMALPLARPGVAARSGDEQARKPRIAILDFDYATVHSNVSAIFGTNVDIGQGVSDLLLTYLVKDGTFSIIERKALDKILAEQNFSNSDRADPSSAAKIGKMLGVDAIIVGSITQFGNETKNTGVGGVGAVAGRFGLGGVGQKQTKAIVGLTARIVNVDTGEIMSVAEGMGESKRTSTSLTGGGGAWSGFGAGRVDFGSSNFQGTIIGEAVRYAVEKMTTDVLSRKGNVQARASAPVVVNGLVAAVAGGQLILNVGSKAGVKVGDQLSVERPGEVIKDPASGKVLRVMTTKVGVVKIVEVDADSSVAETVSGSGFRIKDIVKTIAQ
jgi:curli biogenesis system outer membrane secretion channel CsgG